MSDDLNPEDTLPATLAAVDQYEKTSEIWSKMMAADHRNLLKEGMSEEAAAITVGTRYRVPL